MTDSTQEREARNYIKEVVADLETELEMYEQALARANAVIERVVALEAPEEPSVDDENADDLTYDMECDAWAKGYARALETVRRTILEGNGA